MDSFFDYGDDLGPAKIIHFFEPSVGLAGVLVVDNVAAGPSVGGIRMAEDVTTQECCRLARAMTMKNAAAGLPHGGGKVVVRGDPRMPAEQKEQVIRALANALRDIEEYILAPDMGTDEQCMAWIKDEVDRVVGLPREVGGIPLDEIGATGWGVSRAALVAAKHCDLDLKGARVVVQGMGAVGNHAARFLSSLGCVLVGAVDTKGTLYDPSGLNVEALIALKNKGGSVIDHSAGEMLPLEAAVGLDCDIWVPAARPDVIHEDNQGEIKARLILEGANIPITPEAEKILHKRGVLCIPDFIANAGGVICAAMEYQGSSESAVLEAIEEKITHNTEQVLLAEEAEGILPREAAIRMAEERVRKAMSFRRWSIF